MAVHWPVGQHLSLHVVLPNRQLLLRVIHISEEGNQYTATAIGMRHLAYRVKLQKKRSLSPEAIREALLNRQCSVLRHIDTGQRYAISSSATAEAQLIYEALGLTLSDVPYALN